MLAQEAPRNPFANPAQAAAAAAAAAVVQPGAPAAPGATGALGLPPPLAPNKQEPAEFVETIPAKRLGKVNGEYLFKSSEGAGYVFESSKATVFKRQAQTPEMAAAKAEAEAEAAAATAEATRTALPSAVGSSSPSAAPQIPAPQKPAGRQPPARPAKPAK